MPAKVERCVKKVKKTIKPKRKGQTKEEAAYAVCNASVKKESTKQFDIVFNKYMEQYSIE